jgi:hypothetical protein
VSTVVSELLCGPLAVKGAWPLVLAARLCDLRPLLLPKGRAGRGYRAIARNGRVLLASDRPVEELRGRVAVVRLQTWHRAILPGDLRQPYGILVCVHDGRGPTTEPVYQTQLVPAGTDPFDLGLDLGGGRTLVFQRRDDLG